MKKIFGRAWRGALLQPRAFQEVYWDDDSTADGVIVVAAVQVVVFLGALAFSLGDLGVSFITALLQAMVSGVASWLIMAVACWVAATKIFKANGSMQVMMAMHGLAYLPLLLNAVRHPIAAVVALLWYLVVLVVATREAVETDTRTAALSVLIGFAIMAIITALFRLPFTAFGSLF